MPGYSEAHLPTAEFSTATKNGLLLAIANFQQLTLKLKYTQSDKVNNLNRVLINYCLFSGKNHSI